MKKQLKFLFAALLFVLVLAPAAKVSAAEKINLDDFDVSNVKLDNPMGENYTGAGVTNLMQSAATAKSVTISWSPANGAVKYLIYDVNPTTYSLTEVGQVTATSYTLSSNTTDAAAVLAVFPVDAAGNIGDEDGQYSLVAVYTLPSKITKIAYNDAFGANKKLDIQWLANTVADGYDAVCYNKKGKVVQKINVKRSGSQAIYTAKFKKTNTQNVYQVVIKPYIYIQNGAKKVYGADSKKFYAVPQPRSTTKNSDVGTNGINLKWKKVNGATKYDILVSLQPSKGYKKAGTVKGSKTGYSVIKYKNKPIDTTKRYYYAKVITYAKFGKKTVKSEGYCYTRFHTTITYTYR